MACKTKFQHANFWATKSQTVIVRFAKKLLEVMIMNEKKGGMCNPCNTLPNIREAVCIHTDKV